MGTLVAANLNIGPNVLKKRIFIDYQLKPGDEFSSEPSHTRFFPRWSSAEKATMREDRKNIPANGQVSW